MPVHESGRPHVLNAVQHRAQIAQTHHGPLIDRNDERQVVHSLEELIVGVNLPAGALVGQLSDRPIGIRLS